MRLRRGCRLWWLILPVFLLDRLSKYAAQTLLPPHGAHTAVPGVLSWAYTRNHGAAFSLLSGRSILLIVFSLLLVAGLLFYLMRRADNSALERAGLWLIIGGGVSNLFDRLAYGYVVDFIRLDFMDFPVFNLADVFVCAGAFFVVLSVFLEEKRGKTHGG